MADRYGGAPWLASAAYNAGPMQLDKWLAARGDLAPDLFVATMPYHETRDYVAQRHGLQRALRLAPVPTHPAAFADACPASASRMRRQDRAHAAQARAVRDGRSCIRCKHLRRNGRLDALPLERAHNRPHVHDPSTLVLLGATGFVGRYLVPRLAADGHRLTLLSRNRERHRAVGRAAQRAHASAPTCMIATPWSTTSAAPTRC